jgi:hypothetical protein
MLVLIPVPPTHKWNQESSSSPALILVLKIRFTFDPVLTNWDQNWWLINSQLTLNSSHLIIIILKNA